jgi:hypothetical protein
MFLTVKLGEILAIQTNENSWFSASEYRVEIITKDHRHFRLYPPDKLVANSLLNQLTSSAFLFKDRKDQAAHAFARTYFASILATADKKILEINFKGWKGFALAPLKEFERMGCTIVDAVEELNNTASEHFRVWHNKDFETCATYPEFFLVPAFATDEILAESVKFRSSQRIPALTYFDREHQTCLWRCS